MRDDSLFTFFKKDTSYKAPAFADLDGDKDSDLLIWHGTRIEVFENRYQDGRENWARREFIYCAWKAPAKWRRAKFWCCPEPRLKYDWPVAGREIDKHIFKFK